MKSVERNVIDIGAEDRECLERILGERLDNSQRLKIVVTSGPEDPIEPLPTNIELDRETRFALYSPCTEPGEEDSMLLLWDNERDVWLTYIAGEFSRFSTPSIGLSSRGMELVTSAFRVGPPRYRGQDLSNVHPSYLLNGKPWDDVAEGYKAEGWGYGTMALLPPRSG